MSKGRKRDRATHASIGMGHPAPRVQQPVPVSPSPLSPPGMAPGPGVVVFLLCFLLSGVIVYQIIAPPASPTGIGTGPAWSWLKSFRAIGFKDQLGYAAIASNVKWLNFDFVEPYTSTGSIIYTRNWYVLIGLLAWALDIPVMLSWQVCGMGGFLLGLGCMAYACYRHTSRYWVSLIPGMLALTGMYVGLAPEAGQNPEYRDETIGYSITGDAWAQRLVDGRYLWSPYVLFYVLNAEVGACALLMIAAWLFFQSLVATTRRTIILLLCASAFIVGFVSSVSSYFFLAATLVSLATIAFFELHTIRRRTPKLLSWLLPTLLFVGWVFLHTGTTGGLGYYAIGVLPIAYLVLACSIRHLYPAVLVGTSFLVGLLPQLLPTILAILSNDPFLAYRQTSSAGRGPVPFVDGVVAAAPFLIIMLLGLLSTFATDTSAKSPKRALALGCIYGFFMLSWNDIWGFHQEPHRLWIDTLALSILILSPLYAEALVSALKVFRQFNVSRLVTACLLVLFGVFYVQALPGFGAFRDAVRFFDVDTPHLQRQLSLIRSTDYTSTRNLILWNAGCGATHLIATMSPFALKVTADVNVAHYRAGMAWPANRDVIDKLRHQLRVGGALQVDDLIQADIFGVLTHSTCRPPRFRADGSVGQADGGVNGGHERIEIVQEPAESRAGQDDYYSLYRVRRKR